VRYPEASPWLLGVFSGSGQFPLMESYNNFN
jgi:hypothetical protein